MALRLHQVLATPDEATPTKPVQVTGAGKNLIVAADVPAQRTLLGVETSASGRAYTDAQVAAEAAARAAAVSAEETAREDADAAETAAREAGDALAIPKSTLQANEDILIRRGGVPVGLAAGPEGTYLRVVGGVLTWATMAAFSGFGFSNDPLDLSDGSNIGAGYTSDAGTVS